MSSYRLTLAAEADVIGILQENARLFGPRQQARYAEVIRQAVEMVAAEPECPGSRPRDELQNGLRSFHLERATRRRGSASHALYYLRARLDDGTKGVIVVRVLHERMDPGLHLAEGEV